LENNISAFLIKTLGELALLVLTFSLLSFFLVSSFSFFCLIRFFSFSFLCLSNVKVLLHFKLQNFTQKAVIKLCTSGFSK